MRPAAHPRAPARRPPSILPARLAQPMHTPAQPGVTPRSAAPAHEKGPAKPNNGPAASFTGEVVVNSTWEGTGSRVFATYLLWRNTLLELGER